MPALLLTILLIPIFWVLIVRPQQKRQKSHLDLVASLAPGDRVEAFSGIHGTLVEVSESTVRLEVAEGVVVTMARLAVASKLDDDLEGGGNDERQDEPVQQVTEPGPTTDDASATTDGDLA